MIGLLTATSEERTYVKDDIVTKMMLLEISDDKYGLSLLRRISIFASAFCCKLFPVTILYLYVCLFYFLTEENWSVPFLESMFRLYWTTLVLILWKSLLWFSSLQSLSHLEVLFYLYKE